MNKHLKNKGYTLVELVVVVAIIAVALTVVSLSIATVFSTQARQIGNNIDSLISKAKTDSGYRHPVVYLEIDIQDGNYVGRIMQNASTGSAGTEVSTWETLGTTRVPLILNGFSSGSDPVADPIVWPVCIAVQRGTGRFFEITDFTAAPLLEDFSVARPQIIVANQGGNSYIIELIASTGLHTLTAG